MVSDLFDEEHKYAVVVPRNEVNVPLTVPRSKAFYRVYSAVLITDLVGPLITYSTLKHSLWLPYVVCAISLLLTYPVLYRMPETLPEPPAAERGVSALDLSGIKSYLKFLTNTRVVIGIITVFLAQFRANVIEILLPYVSVRFGMELGQVRHLLWEWSGQSLTTSQVATLLSVVAAVNIVVFLILLPAASTALRERAGWSMTYVNICVARTSSLFLALGAAILAAAPTLGLVVFGKMNSQNLATWYWLTKP